MLWPWCEFGVPGGGEGRNCGSTGDGKSRYMLTGAHFCGFLGAGRSPQHLCRPVRPHGTHRRAKMSSSSCCFISVGVCQTYAAPGRRVWTGAKIGQERAFQAKISFRSALGTPIRQLFPLMGPQKAQRDELQPVPTYNPTLPRARPVYCVADFLVT